MPRSNPFFDGPRGLRTCWLGAAIGLFAAAASAATPPTGGAPSGGSPPPAADLPVSASFPDDPRLDAALKMMARGRFDVAALSARTVLGERADIDRAAAILGIALQKQKKYEEARPFLERARDSSQPFPERRHAAHFLGWCCYHLGDLEAARKAFEKHSKDVPDEPDTLFGLGLVAIGEDRIDDAEKALTKSLEGFSAGPKPDAVGQARVLTRLSDVAMRRGEVEKAEELLERAVKASAVQHETWSKLARVRDRLGKTNEADAARANAARILEALGRKAPDGAPDSKPDSKPDAKPDAKPDSKPDAKPDASPAVPPATEGAKP
jgi:tetratricopeptide (TPR) repeat protein